MSLRAHLGGKIKRLADKLGMGSKVEVDVILVSIIGFTELHIVEGQVF